LTHINAQSDFSGTIRAEFVASSTRNQRNPIMAKGSVKVSKGKTKAPARKEEAGAAPEPFGRLFEPLASVRRDIDRFFEGLAPGFSGAVDFDPFRHFGGGLEIGGGGVVPHVEVSEDKKSYLISAELPGVDEKDITLTLEDHRLTVSGEKKSERKEEKKDYYLSERRYGSFRRSFRVPEDVDESKISAKFDKGVMTIVLPKSSSAKAKGRQIPVA
jgi:HSP20 family protein